MDVFAIIQVIFSAMIVSTIILLLMENRNSVKTSAWIIVLIAFPIVGFIAYLVIGRNFSTNREIRRIKELKKRRERVESKQEEDRNDIMKLVENLSGFKVNSFEELKIYTDGRSLFESMKGDISEAKEEIKLEYYIIEEDEIGGEILEKLKEKSREGVKVRILVDDLGCWRLRKSTKRELKECGIEIESCLKVFVPFLTSHLNYRNHRKIAIFDHRIAYMGGMNIADRYVRGVSWGNWRDTQIRLTGGVVSDLESVFDEDWYVYANGDVPKEGSDRVVKGEINGIQILTSGPDMKSRPMMQLYHKMIMSAKREILIQTPYFMPNETIREALKCVANSGITVRIMIPLKCDERFVMMGSYSYIDELSDDGCEFYFYKSGFLHSKIVMIDSEVISVGSANLDFRSLEHNFELSAVIYDKDVVENYYSIFVSDLKECQKLDKKRWKNRSRFMRLKESVVRLFSPLC